MSSKFTSPFMAKSPLNNGERVYSSQKKGGKKNKVKNTLIMDEADSSSSKEGSDKVIIHKEVWKDDSSSPSGRSYKIKEKVVSRKRGEKAKKKLKKKKERIKKRENK